METQESSDVVHPTSWPDALATGTLLQRGAYQVAHVLGQGGFGITYVGDDTRLRRRVAIKEFFPAGSIRKAEAVQADSATNVAGFEAAKAEFLTEAQILARFDHPSIVHVYTVLEENSTIYIVMEYLQGKTLLHLIEGRGAIPPDEAVEYIEKVGTALKLLHAANLLHRDIKPGNTMVCDNGRVVLLDFGLTKEIESHTGYGTRRLSGTANVGTEGYAPIEQYGRHTQLQPATDIYALGATLYHLLTGQSPTPAAARAAGDVLAPPHTLYFSVPAALSGAVMQALDMDALRRPQTVQDFLFSLRLSGTSAEQDAQTGLEEESCSVCGTLNENSNVVCIKCGSWLVAPVNQLLPTDDEKSLKADSTNTTAPLKSLPAWIEHQDESVNKIQKTQPQEWWRS